MQTKPLMTCGVIYQLAPGIVHLFTSTPRGLFFLEFPESFSLRWPLARRSPDSHWSTRIDCFSIEKISHSCWQISQKPQLWDTAAIQAYGWNQGWNLRPLWLTSIEPKYNNFLIMVEASRCHVILLLQQKGQRPSIEDYTITPA